jgi:signal transduction histidine kinase
VEVAAYRIVTEAITNTIRHAAASLCTATLEVGAGRLTVSVRDDGTGLGEAPRRGVGLISMRERTEELGGSFETTSPKTGGTVVVATIPLMNGQAQDEVRAPSSGRAGGRSG